MPTPFYHTISQIRLQEKVIVYDKLLTISDTDRDMALEYLSEDYCEERMEYPCTPPGFHAEAALWAARTLYFACQFMLHRDLEKKDLTQIFIDCPVVQSPAAIVSVDLCLRFLPAVITHYRAIAPDDLLIPVLEHQLQQWHYSGIGHNMSPILPDSEHNGFELPDFSIILANDCIRQLYVNRIIEKKAHPLAEMPVWNDLVKGALGLHADIFWKQLI